MSRIRMYIHVHNESDAKLLHVRSTIASGDWTPGLLPPAVVQPGQSIMFEGEGSQALGIPTTGTEGHVWYNILGGGELYIHWNSPLVESAYDNTFHIFAPANWEVSHWGGQGHEATLHIRVRRTARRSVRNFHAAGRGLAFTNRWSNSLPVITVGYLLNKLLDILPIALHPLEIRRAVSDIMPITRASAGLCGGMVFAVMDYFYNHVLPPTRSTPPSSSSDMLFQFIRDRLWDSFDIDGRGWRFLAYSSPLYPNGDEGVSQTLGAARGRSWISYREEWPKIQADIDAGRPSPVGLVQTSNLAIGDNHQVLAYAYERSAQRVSLYIYDPNKGQNEVGLHFDVTATDGEVQIVRTLNGAPLDGEKRIWAFFKIENYVPHVPPEGRKTVSIREKLSAATPRPPVGIPWSLTSVLQSPKRPVSISDWVRNA